jgi:hypothetical protein
MIEHESTSGAVRVGASGSGAGDRFEADAIGAYLRRQRVLRGISTEELASLTRIPLRSLERLEQGQFDGETDGFVRGFVRTVANALGLDADDALARMLREPTPGSWEGRPARHGLKQVLAGLVLLMLLGLAFLVLRAGWTALLGSASTPGAREVVVWHDPVRALAEATGAELDPTRGIDPSAPTARPPAVPPERAAEPPERAPEPPERAPEASRQWSADARPGR